MSSDARFDPELKRALLAKVEGLPSAPPIPKYDGSPFEVAGPPVPIEKLPPAMPVKVEWCMVCEVAVHETICDRCSRLVCYGCIEDGETLCIECVAEEEAGDA